MFDLSCFIASGQPGIANCFLVGTIADVLGLI